MSVNLLYLTGAAYVWVAIGYARGGRWGMAVAFIAYAIANVGFAMDGGE